MNILFKRSELENGSVINFNFHNNEYKIEGKLPEPFFENDYLRIFKEKNDKFSSYVILYKDGHLNYNQITFCNKKNDEIYNLNGIPVFNPVQSNLKTKKYYTFINKDDCLQCMRKDNEELLPLEEFVKKYQHCESFYELYNTLNEEGYFFTHGIWDDSYYPKDFIEIKHPITQKGKRFKKNKLFKYFDINDFNKEYSDCLICKNEEFSLFGILLQEDSINFENFYILCIPNNNIKEYAIFNFQIINFNTGNRYFENNFLEVAKKTFTINADNKIGFTDIHDGEFCHIKYLENLKEKFIIMQFGNNENTWISGIDC